MHLHLPKPLHGWREFLGEVGIIVIGVGIALGAEQMVSTWHWQREVSDSDRRISRDLGEDLVNAYERLAINTCLQPRLAELRDELLKDQANWPGSRANFAKDLYNPGFPSVYRTPNRTWSRAAWETASNGETLGHFGAERVTQFANLFDAASTLERGQAEEAETAASLGDLAFPGPISATERRANLKLVAKLDALNARIMFESRQILDDAAKARVIPDAKLMKENLDQQRSYRGNCVRAPAMPAA